MQGQEHITTKWNPVTEKVAYEKIRELSLKRPLGRICSCCHACCFYRASVINHYVHWLLLFIAGLVMLIVAGVEIQKIKTSETFHLTNCTTVSSNITGTLKCNSCPKTKNGQSNAAHCFKPYPCLETRVSYLAGSEPVNNTIILQKWAALFENTACMVYEPDCSDGADIPAKEVKSLQEKYSTIGSTYECYYNPGVITQVILELHMLSTSMLVVLILGAIFIPMGIIPTLIVYFACGCKYVWNCKPHKDIVDTAKEQQQQKAMAQPSAAPPSYWGATMGPAYGGVYN